MTFLACRMYVLATTQGLGEPPESVIRDFKDTVYPFFESETFLLENVLVLFLDVKRFFESRDV